LIELALNCKIQETRVARMVVSEGVAVEFQSIMTAVQLLDAVQNESGMKYAEVVRKCIIFSTREGMASDFAILDKIVRPLQGFFGCLSTRRTAVIVT